MESTLRRYLRDWNGSATHLHAQGNEGRHDEFLVEFKKYKVIFLNV